MLLHEIKHYIYMMKFFSKRDKIIYIIRCHNSYMMCISKIVLQFGYYMYCCRQLYDVYLLKIVLQFGYYMYTCQDVIVNMQSNFLSIRLLIFL